MTKRLNAYLFFSAFICVYCASSAWAASFYYADICATTTSGSAQPGLALVCRTSQVQSSNAGPGPCLYYWRRDVSIHKYYYACPFGEDWTAYDTDGDGSLNGDDPAPYDPAVFPPPGNLSVVDLDATVTEVQADVSLLYGLVFGLFATILGALIAYALFKRIVKAAS